ncbi:T9SS type A sorting domain-containing protein [Neolewinella antarctica]|uniref:Secretion system C-terminal sorting domain-containing protein n=1 Tax=Neolewinella antarctica TaxID=442734 RepID=A0ABX0XG10_9BACT|nr:T9SS type A sorting domain-containing protein [Neolewinella antarctica]NJC27808.1 hypothetical protein [Neolewinella antarctica]
MKRLLLFACLLLATAGASAQDIIYVDGDANGANNGTSWADAYTNPGAAFDNGVAGSTVWIAGGLYTTPSAGPFIIDKGMTILGGFAGNETSADAANPTANVTTLSGDVAGNDVVGAYSRTSYSDNNRVFFISDTNSTSTFIVTMDGLTVANGGRTANVSDVNDFSSTGGGIYSTARLALSRVRFTGNRASTGSALCLIGVNTAGSAFSGITVSGNFTANPNAESRFDGGAFYVRSTGNLTFNGVNFSGSGAVTDPTGLFVAVNVFGLSMDKCSFSDVTTAELGSGMVLFVTDDVEITNSTFDDLTSDGGAIFIIGRDAATGEVLDENDFVFSNCSFNKCTAPAADAVGGAFFCIDANLTFNNVSLNDCVSGGNLGGAMYYDVRGQRTRAYSLDMNNSNFTGSSSGGAGGALYSVTTEAASVNITVDGGEFSDNSGVGIGGAVAAVADPASRLRIKFDGTEFTNNTSTGDAYGGAVFVEGTECEVTFNNVTADNNNAAEDAGGDDLARGSFNTTLGVGSVVNVNGGTYENHPGNLGTFFVNGSSQLTLRGATFENNGSGENLDVRAGAAIHARFNESSPGLIVDDCTFRGNVVTRLPQIISGGSAIFVSGGNTTAVPVTITNSKFENNSATGTANGAAVYFLDGLKATIDDCTFSGNRVGGEGGAIFYRNFQLRDTVNGVVSIDYAPFEGVISNSIFELNGAVQQGGVISTQRAVFDLTNNIFANNNVSGPGGGGAVIFNGNSPDFTLTTNAFNRVGTVQLTANVVHNTFWDNRHGSSADARGEHIAFFQTGETSLNEGNSMTINVLNNIFLVRDPRTRGEQLGIEVDPNLPNRPDLQPIGLLDVNLLGGNYFNSENHPDIMLSAEDVLNDDLEDLDDIAPLFTDLDDDLEEEVFDFGLNLGDDNGAGNPLVNGGVQNALVPATDIFGTSRDGNPDIGAVEGDALSVSTGERVEESGLSISFFPNPTADIVTIQNDEADVQSFRATLADQTGRILATRVLAGATNQMNLADVPTGIYTLQLVINGKVYSKQIVKQ